MTRESINERRLRLWKARQEAEGYDVSNVHTLQEAEAYFNNPIKKEVKEVDPIEETQEILKNINNSNDNTIPVKPLEELSFAELQEIGKEFGLKVVGVKRDVLIESINNARQEAAAQAPEAPAVSEGQETPEAPEVTEEVVQAVANAIVEEAQANDATVEAVVNEIVEEGKEETNPEETTDTTTIEDIDIIDELPTEQAQNVAVQPE